MIAVVETERKRILIELVIGQIQTDGFSVVDFRAGVVAEASKMPIYSNSSPSQPKNPLCRQPAILALPNH
jgi:hypothetical protein